MMRNRILGWLVAFALISLSAGAALAQSQLDAPTISIHDKGLYRLTLGVTAGPSGAPYGIAIEWMTKVNYDLYRGWPTDGYSRMVFCNFIGPPTLNLWAGSPLLGGGQTAYMELGDLFDETNVEGASYDSQYPNFTDQLFASRAYAVRARAIGAPDGSVDASEYSNTLFESTTPAECTQGFWKTHPEFWPPGCVPMMLGTTNYSQADLLKIFGTPAQGNGLISLAHQLISAQLNVCNGGTPPPAVAQAIIDANNLIDGLVIPTVGAGSLPPSQTSDLTEILDQYNNGLLGGVIACPTPVRTNSTWGRIKVLYR